MKAIGLLTHGGLRWDQAVRGLALLTLALLSACGSGTIEDPLTPGRIIVLGDGLSYTGAASGRDGTTLTVGRYTVNDASINNWVDYVGAQYGLSSLNAAGGGHNLAQGNACVKATTGQCTGSSLDAQLSSFLSTDAFKPNDLLIVSSAVADLYHLGETLKAGGSVAVASSAAKQAGQDLAALVARARVAGAGYIAVMGAYDVSASPWGQASGVASSINGLVYDFNFALLIAMSNPIAFANVQYIDAAYYMNLVTGLPASYGYTDSRTVACKSGISVNACDTSTLAPAGGTSVAVTADNYNTFVFADSTVHLTPAVHRALGGFAMGKIRTRWGG
jgi:outer membrane lipase/esterase